MPSRAARKGWTFGSGHFGQVLQEIIPDMYNGNLSTEGFRKAEMLLCTNCSIFNSINNLCTSRCTTKATNKQIKYIKILYKHTFT